MSKKTATSQQLATLSFLADYVFVRCVPFLDREGRMTGEPRAVQSTVCPLRSEVTAEAVEVALGQMHEAGVVIWYQVKGQWWLEFPGFDRHQRGMRKDREAPSHIPSPKGESAVRYSENPEAFRRYSAALADQLRTNSGPETDRLPLSEVKGSEGKDDALTEHHPSTQGQTRGAPALPPGAAAVADLTRSLVTPPGQRRVA